MGLLFDERPLVVSPTLAKALGNLNEAVFVQQLHYWLEIKKQAGKNYVDGRYWVYNSVEAWLEQFPWLSSATLRRTIDSLVKKGYVIKGNFNSRKLDHTIWYSLDYEKIMEIDRRTKEQKDEKARLALEASLAGDESGDAETLAAQGDSRIAQNEQIDLREPENRIAQNEQIELSKPANRIAQNEQIELLKMSKSNCSNRADRIAQNEQGNTIDYPYTNTKTTTTDCAGVRPPVDVEEAIALYNELCPSFPKAIGPTPKRKELVHVLADEGISLPQIREAFRRAEQSDFLTGRSAGADWDRYDFDWLIRPSSIVRLLEGKYDNVSAQKQKRIDKNLAMLEKTRNKAEPLEPLTEENVSGYPLYLQEALKRHNRFPENPENMSQEAQES